MTRAELKAEQAERRELRDKINNLLLERTDGANIRLAEQLMQGNPALVNQKMRDALMKAKFVLDLCGEDEVWHGEHQGKKLASLSREELIELLGIARRTQYAMKRKGDDLVQLHRWAMSRRADKIKACIEQHLGVGEQFAFSWDNGVWYWYDVPLLGYEHFHSDIICNLINAKGTDSIRHQAGFIHRIWQRSEAITPKGRVFFTNISIRHLYPSKLCCYYDLPAYYVCGDRFDFSVLLRFFLANPQQSPLPVRFGWDWKRIREEVDKRPEIVQARKGHYYNLNNYKKQK